jgi:transcriptional regulator with XRE-family HTH domain
MNDDDAAPNDYMRALASRIRAHLAKKGWTQNRLEAEAGFPQSGLSRLLAGKQQKIWPKTLHKIARALGVRPEELAEGVLLSDEGSVLPADVGPAFEDLPGYANAELQVARLAPHIPLEVFEEARKTRFSTPPPAVTVEILHAHVQFLADHVFRLGNISQTRERTSVSKGGARATGTTKKGSRA